MGEDKRRGAADAGRVAQLADEPLQLPLQEMATLELLGGACGQLEDPALHRRPNIGYGLAGGQICHGHE